MAEVKCKCGCGGVVRSPDKKGRPRCFLPHHYARKMSPEHIKNMGIVRKGMTPWNKGLTGVQIPWNKGVPQTAEVKAKISAFNTGRQASDATKAKLKLIAKRGPDSPAWRGGIKRRSVNVRIETPEWKMLRKTIYARDGWKCVVCKKPCANSQICHHIIPVIVGGSDDPFNLATVCRSCHGKQEPLFGTPTYFWPQGRFPQQKLRFPY